jgi:hypothetical protein
MTRRSSPRAPVRAFFREMSEEGRALQPDPSPGLAALGHPLPQAGEGRTESQAGEGKESAQSTPLTERARALYEDSAVPVREIARLCGVTERTILKYARKLDWKPRYHWVAGEAGVRHRRWQPAEKFAPVKGTGARFIRREEAGQPFAAGLKALDPQADASATVACDDALSLAREAEAKAAQARHDEQVIATISTIGNLLAEIRSGRAARRKELEREELATFRKEYPNGAVWRRGMKIEVQPRPIPHDLPPDRAEQMIWRLVAAALARWEMYLARQPI